jgi:hypothetical protein
VFIPCIFAAAAGLFVPHLRHVASPPPAAATTSDGIVRVMSAYTVNETITRLADIKGRASVLPRRHRRSSGSDAGIVNRRF